MFCVKCGKQLEDDAEFCPECGATAVSILHPPMIVQPESPAISAPEKVKKTKRVAAVLWSVLLAISLLSVGILTVISMSLSADSVELMLKEVELNDITLQNTAGERVELSEFLYESIDEATVIKYNLTPENIETMLEEIEWQGAASDLISGYAGYFLRGEEFDFTAKDIVKIVEENEEVIQRATNGFRFDYDKLEQKIEENLPENILPAQISDTVGIDPGVISGRAYTVCNIILWGMILLSVTMIWAAARWRILPALRYVGMTMMIVGVLVLALVNIGSGALYSVITVAGLANAVSIPLNYATSFFGFVSGVGAILFTGALIAGVLRKLIV